MLLLVILLTGNVFAVKNYYWNTSAEFPVTSKDMLHGRASLYLEAIRKLIFLLEYPAAGYYKSDYPSVIKVNGSYVAYASDGELLGSLAVYDADGNVYIGNADGSVDSYPYYQATPVPTYSNDVWSGKDTCWVFDRATDYISQAGHSSHECGTYRLWCDGVIYTDTVKSDRTEELQEGTYKVWAPLFAPPVGGWLGKNNNGVSDEVYGGWNKMASRNSYYQWDVNGYREEFDGLQRAYNLGLTLIEESWHIDSYKFLPKQFDPYEMKRPLYKLPATYLDEGKLLVWKSGKLPAINKYYYYDDKHLWKCLTADTTDTPSDTSSDWEIVNLFSTLDLKSFKFAKQGIRITKNQFYNEPIQGAIYSAQGQSSENPLQSTTQYVPSDGYPEDVSEYYPQDLKQTECIMAYIERLFDKHNFAAEVDTEFKENYDYLVSSIYGGTSYSEGSAVENFNAAAADGKVDIIQPITHVAWGCNESGFEWALKQTGDYVWYFDTKYPYFPDVSGWDYDNVGGNVAEKTKWKADAASIVSQFIGNIRGTWRRTWPYSYGFPQELKIVKPSTFVPPRPLFLGVDAFCLDTIDTMTSWYQHTVTAGDSYRTEGADDGEGGWIDGWLETTFETYGDATGSAMPTTDPNTTARFEPDFSYWYGGQQIRKWSINRKIKIVNHIWDVLNVDIGYKEGASLSWAVSVRSYTDPSNQKNSFSEANERMRADLRGYKDLPYTSGSQAVWHNHESASDTNVELCTHAFGRIRITTDIFCVSPNSKIKYEFKLWTPEYEQIEYYNYRTSTSLMREDPGLSGCSMVSLGGYPFSGSAQPRDEEGDSITYNRKVLTLSQSHFSDDNGSYQVDCYVTAPGLSVGAYSSLLFDDGNEIPEDIYSDTSKYGQHNQLNFSLISSDILVLYDWDRVPSSLFYRDGNFPVLVNTFDLPLKPPYPNPPYWIEPQELTLGSATTTNTDVGIGIFSGNKLTGNISNCTSVPSGRTVQYIFRLDTLFNLGTEDDVDLWDDSITYAVDDVVQFNGRKYIALLAGTDKMPYDGSNYWDYTGLVKGWPAMLSSKSLFEYVNENSNWFLKYIDEPKDSVHHELTLGVNCRDLLQDYVWYYNFCHWQSYAKTYEDDGNGSQIVYDDSKVALWGSSEIVVDEATGLDLGCSVYLERQDDGETPPTAIDVYDVDYSWNWQGKNASILNDPNNNPVTTDDSGLIELCNLHEYEPETKVWNDWTKTAVFVASNGKTLPTTILPETEPDWVGINVRAIVTMTSPPDTGDEDIEHVFYTGWVSLLPSGGLDFD